MNGAGREMTAGQPSALIRIADNIGCNTTRIINCRDRVEVLIERLCGPRDAAEGVSGAPTQSPNGAVELLTSRNTDAACQLERLEASLTTLEAGL